MAANGLMYTASFSNVSITNAAQNIWEFIAGAGCSVLIHSIRLTITPTITSGVAQDVRAVLNLQKITTTGTGDLRHDPGCGKQPQYGRCGDYGESSGDHCRYPFHGARF